MTTAITAVLGGFTFEQLSASTTWDITHSLNTEAPVVDCWIDDLGSMTKILPTSVSVIDAMTIQIIFSTPYAGKAYVV